MTERDVNLFNKLVDGTNQVSLMDGSLRGDPVTFACVVRDIVGTDLKSFHPVAVILHPDDLEHCVAFNGKTLGDPYEVLNN